MHKISVENLVFKSYVEEVLSKKKVLKMSRYMQHGNTNCLLHSLAVAYYSYHLAIFLHLKIDEKSLIRGSLLHDYFLYDWHSKYKPYDNLGVHGRIHPTIALYNAKKDFDINAIEEDIIANHMFPLTFKAPQHKETIIVCIIDKICTVYEVFNKNAYVNIPEDIILSKRHQRIFKKRLNPYRA